LFIFLGQLFALFIKIPNTPLLLVYHLQRFEDGCAELRRGCAIIEEDISKIGTTPKGQAAC
jgi:hypothetical protein